MAGLQRKENKKIDRFPYRYFCRDRMQAKKKGIRIYKVKMNNNAWTLFTTKPAAGAQMKENNNHPILLPTSWLKCKCTTMKRNKKRREITDRFSRQRRGRSAEKEKQENTSPLSNTKDVSADEEENDFNNNQLLSSTCRMQMRVKEKNTYITNPV